MRLGRIYSGYSFSDMLRILGIAVLQSFPSTIRKKISGFDRKIDEITEILCKNTIIEIDGLQYSLLDYQSLQILSRDFESYMSVWLKPGKGEIFLDVGAHIGKYTLRAAKTVGDEGLVVAIEAHPLNYQTLKKNIDLNKSQNVIALNLAAWKEDCKLKFFLGSASGWHSAKADSGCGSLEVDARTMDHVLEKLGVGLANWVKIDVEGAEYEVLCGLEETITKNRPKIVVEVFCQNIYKVKRFLMNHGYELVRIARVDISPLEWGVYFLCIP
jgi:FkbM family methyltransferase